MTTKNRTCKSEVKDLLEMAIKECVLSPCGGIGPDGHTQEELDEAADAGHPIMDDDTIHRGQQIYLYLAEALVKLNRI